ncbi:MAG TPA: hypothetical protein VEZ88_03500 [Steroidobacteraceae bacterium]|nr:hypothetical protein [Steroidobacteraceae bacterium]
MPDPVVVNSLSQQIRAVQRRWRVLLAVLAGGLLLTLLVALLWPATYRSSATILIEQQEIPQDLVRSTITTFADQRVQVISQRVMTTVNLLDLIHRYNLYPRQQKSEPRETLIERMRDDIRMSMISADVIDPRSGRPTQANIAFAVSYESRSADLAQKVANELTTLYLNENLTSRTRLAKDTASFLSAEAQRLSGEIAALEQKLADFKERNVDRLPELTQLNFQMMDREQMELRDVQTRLQSLQDQKLYLVAQLSQINPTSQVFTETGQRVLGPADRLKALRTQLASLSSLYAPDHPDVLRIRREIEGLGREVQQSRSSANDLQRQLTDAWAQLAAAREKYTPDHPDVQRLERQVDSLEKQLQARPPAAAAASALADADNPTYIQIRTQLESAQNEIAALTAKQAQIRARIGDFERRLAQAPGVEREYRELLRDHDNAQAKYQELRAKEMEARLAQTMESDRKGERFTVIEPPLPPEKPVSPNRPLVIVLGLLLTIAVALAVMTVRESLDGTVRGRQDLSALLNVAPLAVIPYIGTLAESTRQRARFRLAAFGAMGTILAAAVLVHFLYRPLDVLWFTAMRKFGI